MWWLFFGLLGIPAAKSDTFPIVFDFATLLPVAASNAVSAQPVRNFEA